MAVDVQTEEEHSARNIDKPQSGGAGAYRVIAVPPDWIAPDPRNPRRGTGFDEASLRELGESMAKDGQVQPAVVRPWVPAPIDQEKLARAGQRVGLDETYRKLIRDEITRALNAGGSGYAHASGSTAYWESMSEVYRDEGLQMGLVVEPEPRTRQDHCPFAVRPQPQYRLIAGERRWRAAKLVGLPLLSVRVLDDVDDAAALRMMIAENDQRQDLNPIERAEGYRQLAEAGMKQAEIAAHVHKSQPFVSNAMRLLELPEDVRELISSGTITPSHGGSIASYKAFPKLASHIAKRAVSQNLTAKQIESIMDDPYQIANAGMIRSLGYGTLFDKKVCQKCPFDAYRKGKYDSAHCLKPEHYDELQKQAEEAARVQAEKAVEQAKANGETVPRLDAMRGQEYRRLDSPLGGCRADCQRRMRVIDFQYAYPGGKSSPERVVEICMDTSCHEKLRAAQEKAAKQARSKREKEFKAALEARINQVAEITSRELALLVAEALVGAAPSIVKRAYTRATGHSEEFIPAAIYGGSGERRDAQELLSVLSPIELVRLGVEVLLADEIHYTFSNQYGSTQHPRRAEWYIGAGDPANPESPAVAAKEESPAATAIAESATPGGGCEGAVEYAIRYTMTSGSGGTHFSCAQHRPLFEKRLIAANATFSEEGREFFRFSEQGRELLHDASKLRCGWKAEWDQGKQAATMPDGSPLNYFRLAEKRLDTVTEPLLRDLLTIGRQKLEAARQQNHATHPTWDNDDRLRQAYELLGQLRKKDLPAAAGGVVKANLRPDSVGYTDVHFISDAGVLSVTKIGSHYAGGYELPRGPRGEYIHGFEPVTEVAND